MIKAIKGYKISSGYKFSTYASNCIKNTIKTALSNQSRTIRIPNYLTHIKRKVEDKLRENPDLSAEDLVPLIKAEFKSENTKKQVHLKNIQHCLRLIKMEKRSDTSLKHKEETTRTITPEQQEQLEYLNDGLNQLDERTAEVLRGRFELQGCEKKTLKEIGEQLGLTKERVRQLEAEGLRELTKIYERINTPQNEILPALSPQ